MEVISCTLLSVDGRVVAFSSSSDGSLAPGATVGLDTLSAYIHESLVGPLAESQLARIPINTPVPLTLKGRDPENDPLTFNIVTPPRHGAFSGVAPDLIYEPNADYAGIDRFTFTVSDGVETSTPATVMLRVFSPTTHNTLCSKLGDNPDESQQDTDMFFFKGIEDENITIKLERDPAGNATGSWIYVVLWQAKGGNLLQPRRLDRDSFFFKGIGDEDITIKMEKNPDGVSTGNRIYVVLWQIKNRKIVKPRLVYKQGWMPIALKTTLPETGNYLINVVERRGAHRSAETTACP